MADQLEQQGVQLVAQDADKFVSDVARANSALDDNRRAIQQAAGAASSLSPAASAGASSIGGLDLAVGALGATLGVVAAAIGVFAAALAVAGTAINTALNFGDTINNIELVTGTSAQMAQSIYGAARVSGVAVGSVTGAFASLNERVDQAGQRAETSLTRVSNAADNAAKRLARLNEDYAQNVSDINEQLATRLAEINQRREESEQQLTQRLQRLNEDYGKTVADSRAQLAQRLSDLEENHGQRIADINQRIADEEASVADKREEIERNLNERIADLKYRAQSDIAKVQADGAKDQSRLQEKLQSELASIEQKYASQRQSLQDKIYNPSTNPILRAYYKTQLKSLDAQQKNEQQAAKDSFAAKAEQSKRETQLAVDAINERLARESAIERTHAAQRLADLTADSEKKIAALQAQLDREDAEYQKQSDRLRAEQAKREADARASFERQTTDARAAYDRQIADAAAAQAKIEEETAKRLEREKQRYDRSISDINDSLTRATGGAGAAAKAIDPVIDAFDRLGISVADWQKLTPDQQFDVLNRSIGKLLSEGKVNEAYDILSQLFGPAMAANMLKFFQEAQTLRDLGFTQEQIDSLVNFRKHSNEVGLEFEVLVAQIGTDLLPIVEELIKGFQKFWKDHGPEVVKALRDIATWCAEHLVPAIRDVWNWISNSLVPAVKDVWNWIGNQLVPAAKDATSAFARDFGPAVTTVKGIIEGAIRTFNDAKTSLFNLGVEIGTTLANAFNTGKRAVDDFLSGVKGVYDYVTNFFSRKLEELQNTLNNLRVPSIFTPGSPTPFETGLRGIHDAMQQINRTGLPGVNSGIEAALAGGARGPFMMATAATPSQMMAETFNNTTTTQDSKIAKVTINVGSGADRAAVSDGVYDGLYRAGFVVTA